MDWMFKAALTAAAVCVVMAAARQLGQRAAGVVAAFPVITAPTLAWVSHEQGLGFATSAAVGSVAATAIMAMFALGYARGSRHGGVGTALGCGLVAALVAAVPAAIASARLTEALALALACCVLALVALPAGTAPFVPASRVRLPPAVFVAAASVTAAAAATLGPQLGGFATGLISSLPLIGGCVTVLEHTTGGPRAAQRFLGGYVQGLFGKTVFGVVFALLASTLGAAPALLLACAAAGLFSVPWARAWHLTLSTRL